MEIVLFLIGAIIFAGLVAWFASPSYKNAGQKQVRRYFYSRKDSLMTNAEWRFFERLRAVAAGRYHVFPQIHLSSLLKNETRGKYYKLAFQRINRRSVDFVLCDLETGKPAYAVELDDWSHGSAKRKARDEIVEDMLSRAGVPLVRFRNVGTMTDEQIVETFQAATHRKG